ncbi:hypothetical protein PISL3812_09911 [Talaromyces islandicus]|uniref:Uncharacterized protein n=1 Tax=Talaromyces islandicus TaxID=28573 RepID=A0A0U1MCV0_TALIS|nr:hypothetical protein PISL3812_09911 [Talaromyces islandicus]
MCVHQNPERESYDEEEQDAATFLDSLYVMDSPAHIKRAVYASDSRLIQTRKTGGGQKGTLREEIESIWYDPDIRPDERLGAILSLIRDLRYDFTQPYKASKYDVQTFKELFTKARASDEQQPNVLSNLAFYIIRIVQRQRAAWTVRQKDNLGHTTRRKTVLVTAEGIDKTPFAAISRELKKVEGGGSENSIQHIEFGNHLQKGSSRGQKLDDMKEGDADIYDYNRIDMDKFLESFLSGYGLAKLLCSEVPRVDSFTFTSKKPFYGRQSFLCAVRCTLLGHGVAALAKKEPKSAVCLLCAAIFGSYHGVFAAMLNGFLASGAPQLPKWAPQTAKIPRDMTAALPHNGHVVSQWTTGNGRRRSQLPSYCYRRAVWFFYLFSTIVKPQLAVDVTLPFLTTKYDRHYYPFDSMAGDLHQDPTCQRSDFLPENTVTVSDRMMLTLPAIIGDYNEDVRDIRPKAYAVMDQAHVSTRSRPPSWTYPTEQHGNGVDEIRGLVLPEEFMTMAVNIQYSDGRVVSVDISQDSQRSDLLQSLDKTGWFIVQTATSVDSTTKQRDLEENPIVKSILGVESKEYSLGRALERAMKHGDRFTVLRIKKYRPFNDEYALARPKLFVPQPTSTAFEFFKNVPEDLPTNTLSSTEELISGFLDQLARTLFQQVPYEDWVRQAMGLEPDSVTALRYSYELISNQLHRAISRGGDFKKFKRIAEETNPFAYLLVKKGCWGVTSWRNTFDFDFTSITDPLQEVISGEEDISTILQRLDVLEERFRRYYFDCLHDWPPFFNVTTPFLIRLRSENTKDMAVSITRCDLEDFRDIKISGLHPKSSCLHFLATQWNSLSETVKECAGATELQESLIALAITLKSLRNFYSMIAILQGLLSSGVKSGRLDKMMHLVDPTENYGTYRRWIDNEPALHFLFPLVRAFRSGDERASSAIYQYQQFEVLDQ